MKLLLAATLVLSTLALPAHAADAEPTSAQVDAAFAKADPDKDGTISWKEASRFGITREAFQKANGDKDTTLDKTEFLAAVKYQFAKANGDKDATLDAKEAKKAGLRSKKAFTAADPDKDGTLDLAEYLQALTDKAK